MSEKFDIYSKIFYRDVEKFVDKFVRHLCLLVLRHQMRVWNYFVNSFYSVSSPPPWFRGEAHSLAGEGVGGPNCNEGTDTVVLYVCMYLCDR